MSKFKIVTEIALNLHRLVFKVGFGKCHHHLQLILPLCFEQCMHLANDILPFRNALKRFLLKNSFYNSKEYFN